jgi:hypothetical protein
MDHVPEVLRYDGNQPAALSGIQRDLEIKVSLVELAHLGLSLAEQARSASFGSAHQNSPWSLHVRNQTYQALP